MKAARMGRFHRDIPSLSGLSGSVQNQDEMRAGPGIGTETAFFIAADGPRVPRVGIHCDFPGLILFKQKMGHGPQCEGADAPVPESILPDEQIDPPDRMG